jgi:hypothetical protein
MSTLCPDVLLKKYDGEIREYARQLVMFQDENKRLRAGLDEADDLLSCAEASQDMEGATAEEWDEQVDGWRQRYGYGSPDETKP